MEQSAIKEAVGNSRFIKELAREDNVKISGRPSKEFEGMFAQFDTTINRLKEIHKEWLEQKKTLLGDYLKDIPESVLEESFRNGARTFLQQEYRLFKKESPGELENLHNEEYLETQTAAYFFDFYRSLRIAQRLDITPSVGLEIARRSYVHNPDVLIRLTKDFPEFELGQITRVVSQSLEPHAFLENMRNTIARLEEKYPDNDSGLITYAALQRPANPDHYIDRINEVIPALEASFPDLRPSAIRLAATHHISDPTGFLEKVQEQIPALEEKFPTVDRYVITIAAIGRPVSAEDFIAEMLKKVPELKKKYPTIPENIVQRAYTEYTANPEKYLDAIQVQFPELEQEFSDVFTPGNILQALSTGHKTARSVLLKAKEKLPKLVEKYPTIPLWFIRERVIDKRGEEPEVQLKRYLEIHKAA